MLCNVSDNCVCVLIEQAAKNKRCFLTLLFLEINKQQNFTLVLIGFSSSAKFKILAS